MQSSALKDLITPGMAQIGLFFEVIADIRRLDRPGTNDAAFRSGVRSAIAERLPPLPDSAVWPLVRLAPGSTPADAAFAVCVVLARNSGPVTPLFARLAREDITIMVTSSAHREVTADEAGTLKATPGTRAYEREGVMTAGSLTVATTRLVLIPERLPGVAWAAIQAGEPAGAVLGPYGMHRTDRKAFLSRADATVDASAVLSLGDQMTGTAEELVTAEFCRHVVALDR